MLENCTEMKSEGVCKGCESEFILVKGQCVQNESWFDNNDYYIFYWKDKLVQ